MVSLLRYRGPDDSGLYIDDDVVLGHDRLAILDLTNRAAQPMMSSSGRYVLSYNGEVFNFVTLRREVEARGGHVRSTGDTEVLLEHAAQFGVEATVARLEGDWAFALWDRRERTLVLARDRHGVKPMYYTVSQGRVRFASEMKALLTAHRQPDMATVNACLLGLAGTGGQHTLFRDIRSVRPGEWVRFCGPDSTPVRKPVFSIPDFVDAQLGRELEQMPTAGVIERLESAFAASMDLRMVSDAPLACLVSGGVDSSLVAAVARERNPDLQLYHADVVNDSERREAELLARHLGLDLHVVTVTDEDFLDALAPTTYHNELPVIYHQNSVPFYLVSRLAGSDGVKVLLTGEGSDEYFLGYPQYALAPILEAVDASKNAVQGALHRSFPKLMGMLWPKGSERFSELLRMLVFRFEQETLRDASEVASSFLPSKRQRRAHGMTLTLAQQHLVSLLHRNDRLGMAWSLESRFPFLGHELARLAVNLPSRYKLRYTPRVHDRRHPFTIDKWAVRVLAEQHVPHGLASRGKRGFPVSVYQRMTIDPEFFAGGFVAEEYGLCAPELDRLVTSTTPLWAARLLFLDVWGRQFVMGESVDDTREHVLKHVTPWQRGAMPVSHPR